MAHVIFYEKPSCSGNARQKEILSRAGHTLEPRNLLRAPWTRESLLAFLDPLPVGAWFNRNAPTVKSGAIDPEQLDRETALQLLLQTPLLIRRPLLEVDGVRQVGFDAEVLDAWIGLPGVAPAPNLEACQHGVTSPAQCPMPDEAP